MSTDVEDAADRASRSWAARPALAWCIRAGLVIIPLVAAWLSVRTAVRVVPRPAGLTRTIVWVAGAIALSMLVYQLVERALRRFSSLGMLFSLSLTFPDTAPSRLGAALRAGRVDDLGGGSSERLAKLVATVARREGLMRGHGDRVRGYAEAIGHELGLDDDDLHRLRWVALLHDVGKLDVPTQILDRRGPIDDAERVAVQRHVEHADGYLGPYADFLGPWGDGAADHHERWDGSGYPRGTAGDDISLFRPHHRRGRRLRRHDRAPVVPEGPVRPPRHARRSSTTRARSSTPPSCGPS